MDQADGFKIEEGIEDGGKWRVEAKIPRKLGTREKEVRIGKEKRQWSMDWRSESEGRVDAVRVTK